MGATLVEICVGLAVIGVFVAATFPTCAREFRARRTQEAERGIESIANRAATYAMSTKCFPTSAGPFPASASPKPIPVDLADAGAPWLRLLGPEAQVAVAAPSPTRELGALPAPSAAPRPSPTPTHEEEADPAEPPAPLELRYRYQLIVHGEPCDQNARLEIRAEGDLDGDRALSTYSRSVSWVKGRPTVSTEVLRRDPLE